MLFTLNTVTMVMFHGLGLLSAAPVLVLLFAALLMTPGGALAAADLPVQRGTEITVQLRDGRELSGELLTAWTRPDQDGLELRVGQEGMQAILRFPAADVLSWQEGIPKAERQRRDLSQTIAAVHDMKSARAAYQAAKKSGDSFLERQAARALIRYDRHADEAYRQLGMIPYNGVWMTPYEVRLAQGLVRYKGKWMTFEQQWGLQQEDLAKAAAARERAEERRKARAARAAASAPGHSSGGYFGYATYHPGWAYRPWYGTRIIVNRPRPTPYYGYRGFHGRVKVKGPKWVAGFRW